jgi:Restriction endonuclease
VARPTPPLTNAALFERDGHLCMYCGRHHRHRDLSRDHVLPVSRGGRDTWDNVLTACRACNGRKDNRTPEEAGMLPLGLPYTPDHAAYLLLMGSGRVTGCQQAFLASMAKRRH